MEIFNSLSRAKEEFIPIEAGKVRLYTCGPTVYNQTHIGHVKKYVGDDLLRRSLTFLGYRVKHVENITDVGHLVSDADEGEDKLDKQAQKEQIDVFQLAKTMEDNFFATMDQVNVLRPDVTMRATDPVAIAEQIRLLNQLVNDGYAYLADTAIYFDVSRLPEYNPFSGQDLKSKIQGAREDVVTDSAKRHPADFALWVFRKGIHANHIMHWETPFGDGFPGWHLECSAISMLNLGPRIDIHTGGIEHKEVHHPNEIAQNFAVTGEQVVNYWVHHEHLMVDGGKMSKSAGNFLTLPDIVKRGYDPLALRYFVLTAHYRTHINFTWEALDGAQRALNKLRANVLPESVQETKDINTNLLSELNDFKLALTDDLNSPKALAVVWQVIGDPNYSPLEKSTFLINVDKVLGLNLALARAKEYPEAVKNLASKREALRKAGDFAGADEMRRQINSMGYEVMDRPNGWDLSTKN